MIAEMDRWAADDDFWVRRSSMLCELGRSGGAGPRSGSSPAPIRCSTSGSSSSARRSAGCSARREASTRRGRGVAGAPDASGQRGDDARGGEVPAGGDVGAADGGVSRQGARRLKYRGSSRNRAGSRGTTTSKRLGVARARRTSYPPPRSAIPNVARTCCAPGWQAAIGGDPCFSRSSSASCSSRRRDRQCPRGGGLDHPHERHPRRRRQARRHARRAARERRAACGRPRRGRLRARGADRELGAARLL